MMRLDPKLGLAEELPNRDKVANDLLNRADRMLYQAKTNGRNRVEF